MLLWCVYMWHACVYAVVLCVYVTWLIRVWHDSFMCDMTHSCVTWLIYMWHDSFMCDGTLCVYATWLIHMCDMTLLFVKSRPQLVWAPWRCFANSTRPTIMCVTTLLYMWHDSFVVYDMMHSYVWRDSVAGIWHDSFTCVTWLLPHSYEDAPRCHVTFINHSFLCSDDEFHPYHDECLILVMNAWLIPMTTNLQDDSFLRRRIC